MKRFISLIALILCSLRLLAAAPDSSKVVHRIGIDFRPSIPTRHHVFFRGENEAGKPFNAAVSTHLKYSFHFPLSSRLGQVFPTAYQGIGITSYSFFNKGIIGKPVAVYLFQGAEIAKFSKNLSLDYEWNFGISTGWRTDNLVLGTKVNAFINTAILVSWRPFKEWTFSSGLDVSHFSNGDTTLPNVGVNTFGIRLSAVRSFGQVEYICRKKDNGLNGSPLMERLSLDLMLSGAWYAETVTHMNKEYRLDGKFGVLAFHLNPLISLSDNLLIGPSIDIQYNEGINLSDHVAGINPITNEIRFYRPHISEQIAAGVSMRVELKMPVFSINLGIGHNLIYEGNEQDGIYNLMILKASITPRLYLHTGLKINYTESSNNLLLGFGWKLGKVK